MIYTRICLLNVVTRSEPNLPVEKHCVAVFPCTEFFAVQAQRFHRGIQMIWHTPNRPMGGGFHNRRESEKKLLTGCGLLTPKECCLGIWWYLGLASTTWFLAPQMCMTSAFFKSMVHLRAEHPVNCYLNGLGKEMGMDQYLLIPFLGGWTSIYQLFWCSPGVQGFDPSPNAALGRWRYFQIFGFFAMLFYLVRKPGCLQNLIRFLMLKHVVRAKGLEKKKLCG